MATAPTVAEIQTQFPEFGKAPEATIQAKIDEAVSRTQRTSPEALWYQLICYKVARALALSPNGRSMKLAKEDGTTVYDTELTKIRRALNIGFRTY